MLGALWMTSPHSHYSISWWWGIIMAGLFALFDYMPRKELLKKVLQGSSILLVLITLKAGISFVRGAPFVLDVNALFHVGLMVGIVSLGALFYTLKSQGYLPLSFPHRQDALVILILVTMGGLYFFKAHTFSISVPLIGPLFYFHFEALLTQCVVWMGSVVFSYVNLFRMEGQLVLQCMNAFFLAGCFFFRDKRSFFKHWFEGSEVLELDYPVEDRKA